MNDPAPLRATPTQPPLGFWLLIALLALCAASKAILYDTMDPDCFWHLRVAEQLHRDGIGPIIDNLSFASSNRPWTPYSWLAELGMKAIWDFGGFRAAIAIQAITQAAIVVMLALCSLQIQKSPRYLLAALATAAGTFLTLPYLSFRPVTFAILILAICTWLLLRDRKLVEQTKAVWLIIPLTALLTNIHLFAFFVPLVVMVMWLGAAGRDQEAVRRVRRYSWMLSGTMLAFLATPMLPGLLKTIAYYSSKDQMVQGPVLAEMQSFARGPMGMVAAIIVAAVLLCAIVRWKQLRAGEWICLAAGTILLFKLGRFAPIFALIACPVLAATGPHIRDRVLASRPICGLLMAILLIGTGRIIWSFPSQNQTFATWLNRNGPDAPGYPCEAADYTKEKVRRSTGRIINEFSWGGYLEWALADQYQVLLDGRTQVFPQQLWQVTYLGSDGEREKFLSTLSADAAVLPAKKSQFHDVLAKLGWNEAYSDQRAVVMIPPQAAARIEP